MVSRKQVAKASEFIADDGDGLVYAHAGARQNLVGTDGDGDMHGSARADVGHSRSR